MVVVKKIILLIAIFTISIAAHAESAYVRQSKSYFKNGEYAKARETILKNRDIFKKTPTNELIILALTFEKEGNYKNLLYYELILKYHHASDNQILMRNYKKNGIDDLQVEVSKRLSLIYFYMGRSLYELAYQSYIASDNNGYNSQIKQSKMYLELAAESEGKFAEDADKYLTKVEKSKTEFAGQSFQTHYGLSITSMYWNDDVRVKAAGNVSKESQASSTALRLGVEYQLKREDSSIHISTGIFFGKSNIGNTNDVGFYQSDLSNYGFDFTPAIHFFSPYKDASIGIGLPLIYRVITFDAPETIEIEGLSQFSQGLEIQSMWYLKNVYFNVNFGKITHFKGMHLGLRIGYLF